MTTAIASSNKNSNVIVQSGDWSREKIELLKRTICKGANDDELAFFVRYCQKLGLEPPNQICAVFRWDDREKRQVMTIQIMMDGYRLFAERTGEYLGSTSPQWLDNEGNWHEVWTSKDNPVAAKVGVMRKGFTEPQWAVARFSSYSQTTKEGNLKFHWQKMPDVMVANAAERLALRKAFPSEFIKFNEGKDGLVAVPEKTMEEIEKRLRDDLSWYSHEKLPTPNGKNFTWSECGDGSAEIIRIDKNGKTVPTNGRSYLHMLEDWQDGAQELRAKAKIALELGKSAYDLRVSEAQKQIAETAATE